MNGYLILGIHLTRRVKSAARVQKLLTAYGCQIKTRLGLHNAGDAYCSPSGLILLELVGDAAKRRALEKKLKAIPGLAVKRMEFR